MVRSPSAPASIEALRDGGNAIDAAVTACAVQRVVEAGSTGIGGDCFVLLSRGGSADLVAYNGSGRTPMAAGLKRLIDLPLAWPDQWRTLGLATPARA